MSLNNSPKDLLKNKNPVKVRIIIEQFHAIIQYLTLSWWRLLSYRNQSIDLQSQWAGNGLRHERVKENKQLKILGVVELCPQKCTKEYKKSVTKF